MCLKKQIKQEHGKHFPELHQDAFSWVWDILVFAQAQVLAGCWSSQPWNSGGGAQGSTAPPEKLTQGGNCRSDLGVLSLLEAGRCYCTSLGQWGSGDTRSQEGPIWSTPPHPVPTQEPEELMLLLSWFLGCL